MAITTQHNTKPAYKEPWFWAVFSPLILVVIVCSFLVSFAFIGADDRVYDDYYKQGRMINNRFEAEGLAVAMGLKAELLFDQQSMELIVKTNLEEPPQTLSIQILHPSDAEKDTVLDLQHFARGQYRTDLAAPMSGRWYLILSSIGDAPWKLSSEIDFATANSVEIDAASLFKN